MDEKEINDKLEAKQHLVKTNSQVQQTNGADKKSFVCEVCSKTFTLVADLKRHIRTTHSRDKLKPP